MLKKDEQNKNDENKSNDYLNIDIKKELSKLKNETVRELKEILYEIEKTA